MNAPEMLAATGISYRQLNYWTGRGWLRTKNPPSGSGVPNDWPATEIAVAQAMAALSDAGIKVETAATMARALPVDAARYLASLIKQAAAQPDTRSEHTTTAQSV